MSPKEIVKKWVDVFNSANAELLSEFYLDDAINHQVANEAVVGKTVIKQKFVNEFETAKMVCIIENIFEDGNWAMLEWKDPDGLRGCSFFQFENNKIKFQRGYWDKLSFLRIHKLPIPTS